MVCVLVFVAAGCSSFNHDWRAASATVNSTNDLAGRWQGSWHSDANGHSGKLKCVIAKQADTYRAHFHANYLKVLSFSYSLDLHTERNAEGGFQFTGSADLGTLGGGQYEYKGHAEGTNFFSTYSSKYEHGMFQMRRVY
jgi:hypothetical protein